MKTNTKPQSILTHEGAKAKHINAEQQLRRSVMACMLWENSFYEDGVDIAERIAESIKQVDPEKVYNIAVEARTKMNLRHAPLFIAREMARIPTHKAYVDRTLSEVILRADELAEFLAIYWKDKKQPLSAKVKKGLAKAFTKFDEYGLAKYNRDNAIKLRDVLFLCHAKPKDDAQEALWKRLIDGTLQTPDTWEVELSKGKGEGKKEAWTRLLYFNKLGTMALLRNLRNIIQAGVERETIKVALVVAKIDRILPFRFITAARYAPIFEPELEDLMFANVAMRDKLSGKTVILVDVSGSMDVPLSAKSEVSRMDAACGIAMVAREMSDDIEIYSFSNNIKLIPARHGFALRDAITGSQGHGGTNLGGAIRFINSNVKHDRLIVITDEQSHTTVPDPTAKQAYMINVSCDKNGVGYGKWIHIDGFSEAVLEYVKESERDEQNLA